MTVSEQGQSGTIGGGRLEYDAIRHARNCLAAKKPQDQQTIHLGPEIGQCCGGKVGLSYTRVESDTQTDTDAQPILIFGGGHVGRALARAFADLPCDVQLVETRAQYLENLPSRITPTELAAPEAAVRQAPPNAAYIVTTHDHALDFLIVHEAISRGDAAYVGMIGSKTKRAVLEAQLTAADLNPERLTCPIGAAGLGDKRPEIIAAFTVAEVLDRVRRR